MYLFIVAVSSGNVSSYQFTLAFSSTLANPVTDSKPVEPRARWANKGIASNTQNMSCIKDKGRAFGNISENNVYFIHYLIILIFVFYFLFHLQNAVAVFTLALAAIS